MPLLQQGGRGRTFLFRIGLRDNLFRSVWLVTDLRSYPNIATCRTREDGVAVQGLTLPVQSRVATQMWVRRGLGLMLCTGIAALAEIGGSFVPLVGAPLFAIAIGVLLANALPGI